MSARGILAGLVFALLATSTVADEACRVAYDIGSSGIRAGASSSDVTARADIDYLAPLWAGRGLEETVLPTIAALRELREKAGFAAACERVGGGFSAWRLATAQGAGDLAGILDRLWSASGVAILVIPQGQEGAYGYFGARQLLGDALSTTHILDIGGGQPADRWSADFVRRSPRPENLASRPLPGNPQFRIHAMHLAADDR